ncbi:MAG TPA: hypothetical protein VIE69_06950 [Methylophilaceae bacterium]|jgi:ABC-type cobalamin/Fe3+-siderophores transport system ATPase subunit
MSVTNKSDCTAYLGKPGSGKSTLMKRRLKALKPKRLMIWSPDESDDNYKVFGKVYTDMKQFAHAVMLNEFKAVFVPSMVKVMRVKQFEYFCKLAWLRRDSVVLVEELKSVTSPSYAPDAWSNLSLRGRKRGIVIMAATQRPAQIDKDFLGCTSDIYALAMKYPKDRQAAAEAMVIDRVLLENLQPLDYVHTGDDLPLEQGRITF